MNNPLFSFVAWICFFKLTVFGLVMCVTSFSVVGKEFSPTAFSAPSRVGV